jgi:hypothetical protein
LIVDSQSAPSSGWASPWWELWSPSIRRLLGGPAAPTSHRTKASELIQALMANPPPGTSASPTLPPKDDFLFLFLDKVKFSGSFAGDVDPKSAALWPIPRCRRASTVLAARSLGAQVLERQIGTARGAAKRDRLVYEGRVSED